MELQTDDKMPKMSRYRTVFFSGILWLPVACCVCCLFGERCERQEVKLLTRCWLCTTLGFIYKIGAQRRDDDSADSPAERVMSGGVVVRVI